MAKIEDDENDENRLLKDCQRLRVPLTMMDSVQKSVYADALSRHPSLYKPGYRFATDSAAKARVNDALAEYDREISERYKHTNDQGEGSPCKSPTGEAGIWQTVAGKMVCTPQNAARTSDRKLLDEGWDAGDDREQAYREYDQMLQDAWRSK